MPTIILEGQTLELTLEQTATDQAVIDTLLPFYPDVANAEIRRRTDEEGEVKIEIVKRFGSKGNSLFTTLTESSSTLNPALGLSWQLKRLEAEGQLTIERLIALSPQIEAAIAQGEKEVAATKQTARMLKSAQPLASPFTVLGF